MTVGAPWCSRPASCRSLLATLVAGLAIVHGGAAAGQLDHGRCPGDCSGDALVSASELVVGVHVALGTAALERCAAFDADGSGQVEIDELVAGVASAVDGCPIGIVAEKAFFDTLNGVRDRADEAVQLLEQAVARDPQDGRSYFLLGMMHLFQLSRENTDIADPSERAKAEIEQASTALDAAVPLLTGDTRVPGFRAGATYVRGVLLGELETERLGLTQLRDAFALYPLFNTFDFIGTVPAIVAPGDPLLAEAVSYLEYALSPEGLARCTPRICFNEGKAPHNIEGSFLLFGDIFAKAGDRDRAQMYYQGSASFAAASGWRFRASIEERLATLDQRIALYQDGDPANDPPVLGRVGTESCAYCHYR